jgi:protein phosphatase
MGGAAAGDVASRYFAETAVEIFTRFDDRSEECNAIFVQWTFAIANRRILDHIRFSPDHGGMGCTAEMMVFTDGGYILAHIGDSRTYRFRSGRLQQMTRDHSIVQNLVESGAISSEDARRHPQRNVILQSIGTKENPVFDMERGKCRSKDLYLLCSDGLTDLLDDELITETLSSETEMSQKASALVEMAKMAGGHDNITVVLCEIP